MRNRFKKAKTTKAKNKVFKGLKTALGQPKTPLTSRGNRPLQMSFDEQMDGLIYFHLEGFDSGRELLQPLAQNPFAKEFIAPAKGIQKSAFFEALNTRGLEQMIDIYEQLNDKVASQLPDAYPKLGKLVAIDGTLIDATLSME